MADVTAGVFGALEHVNAQLTLWGGWGVAATLCLFALAAVSVIPRPALCVLAGATYGLWGIPIALAGTIVGAALAFALGCLIAARWPRLAPRQGKVRVILDAVRAEGWRVVALMRMVPVLPSSLTSLVFGISAVAFIPYCLATAAGILPGIILEVILGATAAGGARGDIAGWKLAFIGVGLAAGVAGLVLVARRVRQKLHQHLKAAE